MAEKENKDGKKKQDCYNTICNNSSYCWHGAGGRQCTCKTWRGYTSACKQKKSGYGKGQQFPDKNYWKKYNANKIFQYR